MAALDSPGLQPDPAASGVAEQGVLRLDDDHPWPGLASYDELSAKWFHGRDLDSAELLRLIKHAPFVVLYGKSGLGKSSMLQAGVFPELRQARFLPVMLRLDYTPQAELPPLQRAAQLLRQAIVDAGADAPDRNPGEGLWAYLQRRERPIWTADNFPLTPVLVFDQFEEVFSRGGTPEHIKAVLDDLGDLVGDRLSTDLAEDRDAARRLNLQSQQYRVVLSFRSDFLAEVESWEKAANLPKRECLHLKAMSREQAVAAVERAGAKVLEPGIATRIVDFVLDRDDSVQGGGGGRTARRDANVEPVLLSLTCFQLNSRRQRPALIDGALLDSVGGDILFDFYREALAGLRPCVATFIEDQLIQGGRYRSNYPRDETIASGGMTADELRLLTERRLLRVDPQGDVPRIELIHDRLVGVVYSGKLARLQREREQREQAEAGRRAREERDRERAEHAEQQRLSAERERATAERERATAERERENAESAQLASEGAARRLSRQRNVLRAAVLLLLLAICGAVYFGLDATRQSVLAKENSGRALLSEGLARREAERANVAAAAAATAASAAEQQGLRAQAAAAEATALMTMANDQARLAEEQRLIAQAAQARALSSTRRAEALRMVIEAQGMLAGSFAGGDTRAYQQLLAGSRLWPDAQTEGPLFDALVSRQHLRSFVPAVVEPASAPTLVAFSPDSRWLVAGHQDGSLSVRDPAAPRTVVARRDRAHRDMVSSMDIARDAAVLLSASHDGSLRLWKLPSLEPLGAPLPGQRGAIFAAAISPDGLWVAAGGEDKLLRLWRADSGVPAGEPIQIDATEINALAFSSDGQLLAVGSDARAETKNSQLAVVDVASRRVLKAGYAHSGATLAVAFAPGDKRVASGGADKVVRVRNVGADSTTAPRLGGHQDEVYAVAFSPDGRWVASGGGDGKLLLWQAGGGGPVSLPETGHSGSITGITFSADGRWLASAADDGSLRLWPLETAWSASVAAGAPAGGATALALAAGGQRWLFGRDDGGLVLRDPPDAQRSLPLSGSEAAGAPLLDCAAPAPSRAPQQYSRSRSAAPQPADGPTEQNAVAVRALAASADGRRAYSAHDDGTLRRWELDKGPTLALRVAACGLTAVSAGGGPGDAARVAVANIDNRVLLLDGNGRRLADWRVGAARGSAVRALALDRSASWLAAATADRRLLLIDTRSAGKAGGNDGLSISGVVDQLTALAFSPDGRWLVSGSSEGHVRLWDVAGRSAHGKPQPAHSREVAAIVFSADGRRFHSSTLGGALREWPAPADWAPLMCAKLGHNPSRKAWNERISSELPYQCPCPGLPVEPDVPGGPPGQCPSTMR